MERHLSRRCLVKVLDKQESSKKKSTKTKKDKSKSDKKKEDKQNDKDDSKKDRKDPEARIPAWKKAAPKDGEKKTLERNNRTYNWCTKCRNGKGMWALHRTDQHSSDFVRKSSNSNDSKSKVTFDKDAKKDSKEDDPAIKVRKELLSNAKSYLSQITDFQEGGAQG